MSHVRIQKLKKQVPRLRRMFRNLGFSSHLLLNPQLDPHVDRVGDLIRGSMVWFSETPLLEIENSVQIIQKAYQEYQGNPS